MKLFPMARSRDMALAIAALAVASCGVKVHPYPPEVTDPAGTPDPGAPAGPPTMPPPAAGTGGAGGSMAASPPGLAGSGGSSATPGGGGTGGTPGSGLADAGPGPIGMGGSDGPPASTVGVTIGGRFVPKERAVVFLHIGHSDMAGRATGPADLRSFMFETHPQLWVYQKGGAFRAAREPTAGDADSAGKSGPGMAILRTALARAPEAYLISIGHGHSGSTIGWCSNFRKGKPLYASFMDEALELKGKVTFGGLFTMFGITEYHGGPSGLASVGDCIFGLLKEVRADLDAPDMPLMVGDWNQGGSDRYDPNGEYGRIVRPQLQMLPMRDPRTGLIPTNGLGMEDDRHLNMAGQKLWAERAFMIMSERGFLAPWGR
jgi:hypothetical protein